MIFILITLLLIAIYYYVTRNHNYWAKRNIKHDPPLPFFGNHFRNVFGFRSIVQISMDLYNKYPKEKVVGYYRGSTPELIVRDLEIAKRILTVDFLHFYRRGLARDVKKEPLLGNLFHADGDTWKLLRKRLTPAFTTAKLKAMFPLVVKCADKLQIVGKEIVANGGECDIRDLMARFTTEFIGACGFGIEMDTINNENSLFRDLGRTVFTRSKMNILVVALWDLVPEMRGIVSANEHKVERIITQIFNNICEQRNGKPANRHDFIDLLLELENKGKIEGESVEKINPDGSPVTVEMEMDIKCMVAQVFVFFAAGFETSSSATSFTLHELAYHPEIQRELQNEIDTVLKKYDNKLCYDAIAEMRLVGMAFKEGLRMFPSLGVLNRECARQYTIPELNVTIDPGVKVIIPVQAIQNDPENFDNPSEFRPERFADPTYNKYAYLAFGDGPRACIGARLGEMQSLAGLASILHNFNVEPASKTRRTLKVNPALNVVQGVEGGAPLKLTLRNKSA